MTGGPAVQQRESRRTNIIGQWHKKEDPDSERVQLMIRASLPATMAADDEGDEAGSKYEVMEDESEKEKKPWKCLEGSNGFFIYKNVAENCCGSSPK